MLTPFWISSQLTISGGNYVAPAVRFNGTNTTLTKNDITGMADGKQFSFSYFIKFIGGDAADQSIFRMQEPSIQGFGLSRTSLNKYNTTGRDSTSTTLLYCDTTSSDNTVSKGWMHVCGSAKMDNSSPKFRIYVNGSADGTSASGVEIDGIFNFTAGDNPARFGSLSGASQWLNAELSEFWWTNTFIDFTVAANIQKFRTSSGKPVFLGSNGQIPTGTAPLIYMSGNAANFATNFGTGGAFTVSGSLTDAASSPSA